MYTHVYIWRLASKHIGSSVVMSADVKKRICCIVSVTGLILYLPFLQSSWNKASAASLVCGWFGLASPAAPLDPERGWMKRNGRENGEDKPKGCSDDRHCPPLVKTRIVGNRSSTEANLFLWRRTLVGGSV